MSLFVNNRASKAINVCFLVHDPSCTAKGQPWRKRAWWTIHPKQTVLPDLFNVDLTTVNQWAGLYAFTGSGESWQGQGNGWFTVSDRLGLDQCADDRTNCPLDG